ncbi:RNA-binding protein 34 [Spea bombifrons]|uniref:RNA-binding protein 34 n=1 Tax=Spea bombifrons TaxID=233779 RepID=UPI002349FA16|nr:RNA-binding protein 34 [Spea bombifrons]
MDKKVKKIKKKSGSNSGTPSNGDAKPPGDGSGYVAGEVAGSLFAEKPGEKETGLFSLFDSKAVTVQPVYVPAPKISTKRKLPEVEVTKPEETQLEIPEPTKKAKSKELSVAERKVADREQALTKADEEEIAQKQKKKAHKTAKTEITREEAITKRIKRKLQKKEEEVKGKRTVFVGNLPVDCTKQALKNLFKEFGLIESVRFRSIAREEAKLSRKAATIQRKAHPKRKNINAYVVFKEEDSAARALKKNGAEVGSGVHIRVDLASKSKSHDNKRSVFVGNLSYEIHEEAMREHFSECGNVEAVRVIRDKATGIGKGFGYVLFETSDAVQLALKLNNSELMGRKLRIKRCVTEPSSQPKNKNFKRKLDTVKQAKPDKAKAFIGETADVIKIKKKTPKPPRRPKKN